MNLQAVLIFEKTLSQESELKDLIKQIVTLIKNDSILLLSGDLGAGKTTTTRYLCEHFGINLAQSPTYAIHQHHENAEVKIDHFDLYRMQNEDDLVSTGFWDLLQAGQGLVVIEWFDRIQNQDWLKFEIEKRNIFGLKIEIQEKLRHFKFFKLIAE